MSLSKKTNKTKQSLGKGSLIGDLLPNEIPPQTRGGHKLALFANTDAEVFLYHLTPTVNRLVRQYLRGTYEPHLAIKAFQWVADDAALVYERDLGDREAANNHRVLCFSAEEREDAGFRLFEWNAYLIEEGILKKLKKEGNES